MQIGHKIQFIYVNLARPWLGCITIGCSECIIVCMKSASSIPNHWLAGFLLAMGAFIIISIVIINIKLPI